MRRFKYRPDGFTIKKSMASYDQVYGWSSNHIGIHHAAREDWPITHLNSGCKLFSASSKKKSFAVAEAISRLPIDWNDTAAVYGARDLILGAAEQALAEV